MRTDAAPDPRELAARLVGPDAGAEPLEAVEGLLGMRNDRIATGAIPSINATSAFEMTTTWMRGCSCFWARCCGNPVGDWPVAPDVS